MDPSGKFLDVLNGGQIQEFSIDATSGALTPLSQASTPILFGLAESPLGGYLYGYTSSGTAVYSIDFTSGALTLVQTASGCGGGKMAIDSSERFLHGLASGISACQINPSSGTLTPLSGLPFPTPGFDYITADRRPVAGMPRKSPLWVPVHSKRLAS